MFWLAYVCFPRRLCHPRVFGPGLPVSFAGHPLLAWALLHPTPGVRTAWSARFPLPRRTSRCNGLCTPRSGYRFANTVTGLSLAGSSFYSISVGACAVLFNQACRVSKLYPAAPVPADHLSLDPVHADSLLDVVREGPRLLRAKAGLRSRLVHHCTLCSQWFVSPKLVKAHIRRSHFQFWDVANSAATLYCKQHPSALGSSTTCQLCCAQVSNLHAHSTGCPVLYQVVLAETPLMASAAIAACRTGADCPHLAAYFACAAQLRSSAPARRCSTSGPGWQRLGRSYS